METVFITGGAGFIGSNLLLYLVPRHPDTCFVNLDKLTYAANLGYLEAIAHAPNYRFEQVDICDLEALRRLFGQYQPQGVIHLAAESHVDRSIESPFAFVETNVMGTLNLLQCAKEAWNGATDGHRFYHISTDEVYGALSLDGTPFRETDRYDPHSPYSASKASSDHFVHAYSDTYGLPVVISHCSNNYGPRQYGEKLIPLVIDRIVHSQPIPVYGTGENIRDWLFVEDHVRAIEAIYLRGKDREVYNIGGEHETTNIALVKRLVGLVDERLGRAEGTSLSLIQFVADRLGHDFRYAIDATKLRTSLGWTPLTSFDEGLRLTVDWYLELSTKK